MKSCKIINGKLRCLEDQGVGQSNLSSQNVLPPIQRYKSSFVRPDEKSNLSISSSTKSQAKPSQTKPSQTIPSQAKPSQTKPEESPTKESSTKGGMGDESTTKDLLHPIIGNHITRPNTTEIPELVREKAIMTQGSSEYFESGLNESHVNEYLNKNGLSGKYTIDFETSTNDALVYVNNKSGKATISFRGTQPTNLRDWYENVNFGLIDFKKHPTETIYGKRVKELYNNVVEQYDIEHITGFSKGGFGAITLGDYANIETTTFSPAVSVGHLRTSKNNKHNIWTTTEDVVSVLANPLKLKNKNVNVNTLNPLEEFNTINPADTHSLDNYIKTANMNQFIKTNATRRVSHTNKLTNDFLNVTNLQKELETSRIAQYFIDKRMSYTNFLSQVANKEVNIVDNTLSKNIKRNGLYHKVWKELGGSFTQVEAEHLTRAVESDTKLISSRTQRIDHARAPPQVQMNQRNEMVKEQLDIENKIQELNKAHTEPVRNIGAHVARGIATTGIGALAGNALGFLLNDEELLLGKLPGVGSTIQNDLQVVKDVVKPLADLIPDPVKPDISPAGAGFVMGAITTGSIPMATVESAAAVATYEIDTKLVGEGAKYIASFATKDADLQRHAQIITEGAAAPGLFSKVLQGIGVGLRAVGVAESAIPLPQTEMLGALTLGGAFVAEAAAQFL